MKTIITGINQTTGEIVERATYINDCSPLSNMVTHLMQVNGCNNIWDKRLRQKFSTQIELSGKHYVASCKGIDYITKQRQRKRINSWQ